MTRIGRSYLSNKATWVWKEKQGNKRSRREVGDSGTKDRFNKNKRLTVIVRACVQQELT